MNAYDLRRRYRSVCLLLVKLFGHVCGEEVTHSLGMKISWSACVINEIAIHAALVYPVELTLVRVEVRLS